MSRKILFVLTALLLFSMPSFADNITTGQWYEFLFNNTTGATTGCSSSTCVPSSGGDSVFAPNPAWVITLAGPATLTVTDAFLAVDQFQVFDNAVSLGTTSTPGGGSCSGDSSDPAVCVTNANISKGFFGLGAGVNDITINHIAGEPGAAYFRVDAVPEPGAWVLFGGLLVSLLWVRRLVRA